MRYAKRIRDLLIETVFAVALVTVFVICLFHWPNISSSLPSSLWLKSASNCFNKVLYVGEPSL